jgi:hypothetical protein
VNGSVGKVTGFLSIEDAMEQGIKIGVLDVVPTRQPQRGGKVRLRRVPASVDVLTHLTKKFEDCIWPVVRFQNELLYSGGIDVLCVPVPSEVKDAYGNVEATREQVRFLETP